MSVTRPRTTKTKRISIAARRFHFSTPMVTALATLSGILVGFVAAMTVVLPAAQPASQSPAQDLNAHLAADVTQASCGTISGPATNGAVLGAETVAAPAPAATAPSGGQGGGMFIEKLVGGQLASNTATIENTGSNSDNTVTQKNVSTTTVTNTTT